jgi:hypothetical protein
MKENIKQAVIASQSAIMATLGANCTQENCLEAVGVMAHLLLTDFGKNNKKVSFHNLDLLHRELEAMIKLEKNPHEHH